MADGVSLSAVVSSSSSVASGPLATLPAEAPRVVLDGRRTLPTGVALPMAVESYHLPPLGRPRSLEHRRSDSVLVLVVQPVSGFASSRFDPRGRRWKLALSGFPTASVESAELLSSELPSVSDFGGGLRGGSGVP